MADQFDTSGPQPVEIANKALISIGSAPIQTFDDSTPIATVVKSVYWDTVGWLLAVYPWSFTKKTEELTRLAIPQDPADGMIGPGWPYAYQFPADAIGEPLAYFRFPRAPRCATQEFDVQGGLVYSRWDRLFAMSQYLVDPVDWTKPFTKAAIACLAAEYVVPVSGNSGMLESFQQKAWGSPQENFRGGFVGAAIRHDMRSQPSPLLTTYDPLTQARWA